MSSSSNSFCSAVFSDLHDSFVFWQLFFKYLPGTSICRVRLECGALSDAPTSFCTSCMLQPPSGSPATILTLCCSCSFSQNATSGCFHPRFVPRPRRNWRWQLRRHFSTAAKRRRFQHSPLPLTGRCFPDWLHHIDPSTW